MPRYRDCIFDLDGTLTQPGLIDFDGIKDAIGCPRDQTIIEFLTSTHGARLQHAWQIIDRYERAGLAHARANPDAHLVLGTLRNWGVRCYVLTRNSRAIARATLHCLGLAPYMRDTIGREDARPKPDPDGVHALRARWGCALDRTIMVGDFHFDVRTGAAAGVATAFLTNRRAPVPSPDFPRGHPTHMLHDLRSLLRII